MVFDPHRNLARTTVAIPPSPADTGTDMTLADGSVFPPTSDGEYNLRVTPQGQTPTLENSEFIRVITRAGDVLTEIEREQEGSTAREIQAGDQVSLAPTVKTFTDIEDAINFPNLASISPAQITANQNNYNPTGLDDARVVRLTSDATRHVTGLASGAAGRLVHIVNVGTNNIVLDAESASSTAGNRFTLVRDLVLRPKDVATLQYDALTSRWLSGIQTDPQFGLGNVLVWDGSIYPHTSAGLQAANDALVALGGGTILVGSGTFPLTATVSFGDNIALVGLGEGISIIQRAAGMASGQEFLYWNAKENPMIYGLTVDGNYANISTGGFNVCDVNMFQSSRPRVAYVHIINAGAIALNIDGADDYDVTSSRFDGSNDAAATSFQVGVYGATTGGTEAGRISNCYISNHANPGAYIGGNSQVINCEFVNNHLQTAPFGGGQLAWNVGTESVIAIGNYIHDGGAGAGGIEYDPTTSDFALFIGNHIHDNPSQAGILIHGVAADICTQIEGNKCWNNAYAGIMIEADCTGFTVQNNQCWDAAGGTSQGHGLRLETGAQNHYIVTGNDFRNNATGAVLNNATGTTRIISDNLPTTIQAWATAAPTLKQNGVAVAATVTRAKWTRDGNNLVSAEFIFTLTAAGTISTAVTIDLPASMPAMPAANLYVGTAWWFVPGVTSDLLAVETGSGTVLQFIGQGAANYAGIVAPNRALAIGDKFHVKFSYEAA